MQLELNNMADDKGNLQLWKDEYNPLHCLFM